MNSHDEVYKIYVGDKIAAGHQHVNKYPSQEKKKKKILYAITPDYCILHTYKMNQLQNTV